MEGIFPTTWKEQMVDLISKCIANLIQTAVYVNTAGKLLEALIKPPLDDAIRASGDISPRSYVFRPEKSTIVALKEVVDVATAAQQKNPTLNVKNAFNSLRWTDVQQALGRNLNIPRCLLKMIRNYLQHK